MMKKIFLVLLLAATCSTSVSAQKGMSGLGVNVPFAVGASTTSLGIGVKYYYNISNYFRIEPSAEYQAFHSGGDKEEYNCPLFKAFLNGHVFFASPRPVRPYLIAGLGYVYYEQRIVLRTNPYWRIYYSDDGFNYNVGLGLDFRLSHSWSLQVEATGMSCLVSSNDGYYDYDYRDKLFHTGKWTFLARVGLAYNF